MYLVLLELTEEELDSLKLALSGIMPDLSPDLRMKIGEAIADAEANS